MRVRVWACLSSPDSRTATRRVVLQIGKVSFRLPIEYKASNRLMVSVERWLEWNYWKYFDVSF